MEEKELERYVPSKEEQVLMLLNRALDNTYGTRSKRSLILEAIDVLTKKEVVEETVKVEEV